MSSINDALRRAERDRERRLSVTAASVVSARSRSRKGIWLRAAAGCAAVAIFLALLLFSWLDSGPSRSLESEMNTAAPEASVAAVPAGPTPGPEEGMKLFRMGRVLHQAGKLSEARVLYEDALRFNPELVEARNNLGVVLLSAKDYASAEKAFLDAMDLSPGYVDAQYNLACVYALTGRVDEALTALSLAVRLYPGARQWALVDKDLAGLRKVPGFDRVVTVKE